MTHTDPHDQTAYLIATLTAHPCPDCTATATPIDLGGGLVTVAIEHDNTCPQWREMNGGTKA